MSTWTKAELLGHVEGLGPVDKVMRLRTVRCACGGEIVADAANPTEAVMRHNRTRAHVLWWVRQEADWQGDE